LEELALQRFSRAGIFQAPGIVRPLRNFPGRGDRLPGEGFGKLKPNEALRGRDGAAPGALSVPELNLPAAIDHFRGRKRKRGFGELNHEIPVCIDSEQQIAG
jgi:hypothetical protein